MLHRRAATASMRSAALWSGIWIALAVAFGAAIYIFAGARFGPASGRRLALEYAAGYLLEKSLSVDNMFVFALIFAWFGVSVQHQRRVLFCGVAGAVLLRAAFIAAGSVLIRFDAAVVAFGVLLIYSGIRFARAPSQPLDLGNHRLLRLLRRLVPVTRQLHGGAFFARENGRMAATPLLLLVIFLECSDVLFAVDSVPAVFGVTREPFIVYSSNLFAILGLRSLYLLLAHGLERFQALKYGLSAVLVFVGLKMVWLDRVSGGRFSIGISLAVIGLALGVSIAGPFLCRRLSANLPLLAGAVCLLLSALGLLCAAGPLRVWLPAAAVPSGALYLSAACYAALGSASLYRAFERSHPRPPHATPGSPPRITPAP